MNQLNLNKHKYVQMTFSRNISEIKDPLPLQHLVGDLFVSPTPEANGQAAKRVGKLMLHKLKYVQLVPIFESNVTIDSKI